MIGSSTIAPAPEFNASGPRRSSPDRIAMHIANHPTEAAYAELKLAYAFFNAELFDGRLPPCLITLQRSARSYGYFSPERFGAQSGDVTDEIAMNPQHFASRDTRSVLSTLVHEMVHLWQEHFGKPPRRAYHDRQWAAMMRNVGLIPTSTGKEGGKQTGAHMTHLIEKGGEFDRACGRLLARGFAITWADRAGEGEKEPKRSGHRQKYTCPGCELNAWAKHDARIVCGECNEIMEPQE
jgi:ribosomal protein S27AE